MDSSDWSNGIRYQTFDTRPDIEFKGLAIIAFSAQCELFCLSVNHLDLIPTDSECPSHSDFDILRSSIYRMGKMGGGSRNGTPRTDHFRSGRTFGRVTTPGSDPLLTSHNSRTHFTKRRGNFFSSAGFGTTRIGTNTRHSRN